MFKKYLFLVQIALAISYCHCQAEDEDDDLSSLDISDGDSGNREIKNTYMKHVFL